MSGGKADEMFRRNPDAGEAPKPEDLRFTDPGIPSRSCCCPARPAVKVTMPPAAARAHPVDLWLCGHHYRASVAALSAAGARAEDLTGMIAECPRAEQPDLLPVRG